MTAELLEWREELKRRLARAEILVANGLPDPGFDLLEFEILRFRGQLGGAVGALGGRTERQAA